MLALGAAALLAASIVAPAAKAQESRTPPIVPGDVVMATFLELPELSGEIIVDGDGMMPFPSGERIEVAGLSLVEAERRVREGLREGPLRDTTLSLTFTTRVPVAVLGDVRAPGEYDYEPGMRLIRAVAMAGGYGTHFSSPDRVDELAREYADTAELVARINALRVRVARLSAEQAGDVYVAPDGTPEGALARAEEELGRLRRTEHNAERSVLIAQISPIDERIRLLRLTIEEQEEQYRTFSKRVEEVESLAQRKLTTSSALVDLQLTRSRINTDLLQSKAALADALQNRTRLENELGRLDSKLRREISEDRRQALEELAVLYQRYRFAAVSVGDVGVDASGQAVFSGAPTVTHIITVMREGPEGLDEFAAGPKTALMPGDIVRIRSVLLDGMVESKFTGSSTASASAQ